MVVNSYIWRGSKEVGIDGRLTQTSKKLVTMSSDELNTCYEHCKVMLFNSDPKNLGRYKLLDLIEDQRNRCGVELFLRYLEENKDVTRVHLVTLINTFKNANRESLKTIKNPSVDLIFSNIPKEYANLSINLLLDGCIDRLGILDKKAITRAFIFRQGLWLTSSESRELGVIYEKKAKEKIKIIKEILSIKDTENIFINSKGINYTQLRAMLNLKNNKKYSSLTTDQLTTLRYRILTSLEEVVNNHINSWEKLMGEIEEVAEHNNIILNGEDLF